MPTTSSNGTISINNVVFHKDDLGGIDPRDVAQAIDDFATNAVGDSYTADPTMFTAVLFGDAVMAAAAHEGDLAAQQKAIECKASFWCSNPIGQVATGLWKGWVDVNVGMAMSLYKLVADGAELAYNDISLAVHGDISWADAAGDIYGYVGKANVDFMVGLLLLPVHAMQEQIAWQSALLNGDWEGAAYHGYKNAYDAATIASFFVGWGGAGARAAGVAGEAGEEGAVAGGLRRAVACHSFAPATAVLMADGSTRAIKDVQVGDEVLATDPVTGETTGEPVTMLHLNQDVDLTDVTVSVTAETAASGRTAAGRTQDRPDTAGHSGEVLHTTAHHPFWDETAQAWVVADTLVTGHQLRTADGRTAMVTAVRNLADPQTMHDLTIARTHTYYVIAGTTPVLVHNCGTDIVKYDADHALGQLTQGRIAKASELDNFGASQGWARSRTANGPIKYTDENGIVRITIKRGSGRASGSGGPHVEMRNAAGERVDPYGNPVTRRSLGNHAPIDYDLP